MFETRTTKHIKAAIIELTKDVRRVWAYKPTPIAERIGKIRRLTRLQINKVLLNETTDAFFNREDRKRKFQNAATLGARTVTGWKLASAEMRFRALNEWRAARDARAVRRSERDWAAWERKHPAMATALKRLER